MKKINGWLFDHSLCYIVYVIILPNASCTLSFFRNFNNNTSLIFYQVKIIFLFVLLCFFRKIYNGSIYRADDVYSSRCLILPAHVVVHFRNLNSVINRWKIFLAIRSKDDATEYDGSIRTVLQCVKLFALK